jgi:hypothetical protein
LKIVIDASAQLKATGLVDKGRAAADATSGEADVVGAPFQFQ